MECIERGYSLFRKHRGKLYLCPLFKGCKGSLSKFGDEYFIEIKKYLPHREKLKTYIHELLHLGLEYKELQENGFRKGPPIGLEEAIDELSEVILNTKSELVRCLRFDVERAIISKSHIVRVGDSLIDYFS